MDYLNQKFLVPMAIIAFIVALMNQFVFTMPAVSSFLGGIAGYAGGLSDIVLSFLIAFVGITLTVAVLNEIGVTKVNVK